MEVDSFIYSNTIFPLTACLNLTVGNIAQKQKELHSELKHTLWQTREVVHPMSLNIWKKYLNKFLETYKSKILFSGILKDHLTKYEHAVFYNIRGHYNEKTNGTTQQNTGEWNAAHTRSLKRAYVTQLPCQQRRTYEEQTGTT